MSLNTQDEKCPVCHAYLFEDDDVVYCPDCGAPHHRECYNALGKCGLEQLHGTDAQYDIAKKAATKREEARSNEKKFEPQNNAEYKCRMCGAPLDATQRSCPNCGAPNISAMNGFAHFDFLGGVPADMDIGDSVTADEAKRFVAVNTPRYIQKFATMKGGKKVSWNWTAFLFPSEWFCARKMYVWGIFVSILTVAAALLSIPFVLSAQNLGFFDNSALDYTALTENIGSLGILPMLFMMASVACDLTIRLVVALFGDWWYRGHTISTIKKMRAESEDMDRDYRKYGGINIYAMLITLFAVQYLPTIISGLL